MDLGISPDLDRPVAGRCDPRNALPPKQTCRFNPTLHHQGVNMNWSHQPTHCWTAKPL